MFVVQKQQIHFLDTSGPQLSESRGQRPLAAILAPEIFRIVILLYLVKLLPPPKVRLLLHLKIFLPHHGMFSSCGAELPYFKA